MSSNHVSPWQVKNSINSIENSISDTAETNQQNIFNLSFEDNFITGESPTTSVITEGEVNKAAPETHKPLPDSETYLKLLERKLDRVKKGSKLIDSLAEKREDCMRALLAQDSETLQYNNNNNNIQIELDTPIQRSEIQRHILPVQALTVGETVQIVKHDYLELQDDVASTAGETKEEAKESG